MLVYTHARTGTRTRIHTRTPACIYAYVYTPRLHLLPHLLMVTPLLILVLLPVLILIPTRIHTPATTSVDFGACFHTHTHTHNRTPTRICTHADPNAYTCSHICAYQDTEGDGSAMFDT